MLEEVFSWMNIDIDSLYEVMKTLYDDKEMRISMGRAGRERTKNLFSMELVSTAWADYFKTNTTSVSSQIEWATRIQQLHFSLYVFQVSISAYCLLYA